MTLASLKRTSSTLVSLRKFQQRAEIDNDNILSLQARELVRPLIEEFNLQPSLTYHRIKSYLDEFDQEYHYIRCLSILLVLAKAHHFSDTALERMLAALVVVERTIQFKHQRAANDTELPQWITDIKAQTTKANSDLFVLTLQNMMVSSEQQQTSHALTKLSNTKHINYTSALYIASYIASGFDSPNSLNVVEVNQISRLLAHRPNVSNIVSPLLMPTSVFWSRCVLQKDAITGFVLYAKQAKLNLAIKTQNDDGTHALTVSPMPHNTLFTSIMSKSQVSFKVWFKALLAHQQSEPQSKREMALPEYPIQRPPEDLLAILHSLRHPKSEPSTLATLIANSRFFSQTLQRSAQQLNRMSLPVSDVKQSILTHGMERVGTILTEQVLWSRLTHAYFPLSRQFEHFVDLHRFVSASIAHVAKIGLPQHASLLAMLQLSFLFTHAPLRVSSFWLDRAVDSDTPATLFKNIDRHLPLQSALILAKAWHQPVVLVKALRDFSSSSQSSSIQENIDLLKLSLRLCRRWMNGDELNQAELQVFIKAYSQINITPSQIEEIRNNAAALLQCPVT